MSYQDRHLHILNIKGNVDCILTAKVVDAIHIFLREKRLHSMINQTFDTQRFKLVLMHHQDFSLHDLEQQAYSFTTHDRKFFINIGGGYAMRRPRCLSNLNNISEKHIIKIKDCYHKIIRAKNQKGNVICKKDRNDEQLKRVKLVRK